MSVLDMLTQQLGDTEIRQISQQIGADEGTTAQAVSGALPMLLSALSRNAGLAGGADSLLSALDRDHDGDIMDDLAGFLGGSPTEGNGGPMLGHILGDKQGQVETGLGRMSGLNSQSIGSLLSILAPVVMGALGRTQKQQGLDAPALAGVLDQDRQRIEQSAPQEMGLLGRLLDTDGDGDVMDDVARIGTSLIGAWMRSR